MSVILQVFAQVLDGHFNLMMAPDEGSRDRNYYNL